MPRRKLIRSSSLPYHVTARTNNREAFPLPLAEVWNVFQKAMATTQEKFGLEIFSFLLMPNHFHAMVRTPFANLDRCLWSLMRETSLEICRLAGRINHVYGRRYYWSLIEREQYYSDCYRYLCRNPVAAGLVEKVEDYPWKAVHWASQPGYRPIVLSPVFSGILPGKDALSAWLNTPFPEEQAKRIRSALRRSRYRPVAPRL